MLKPFALTALAGSLAFALAGNALAAKVPAGTALAAKQEIVINNGAEPQSFDPHKTEGVPEAQVIKQYLEGLVSKDEHGKVIPGVATSWSSNADFTEWTFVLRKNARWSNGTPVTAHDFEFAWKRLGTPSTASPYSSYLNYMQIENALDVIAGKKSPDALGVFAKDDYTLVVKLRNPVPYLPSMTAHQAAMPVPKAVVQKHGDAWVRKENIVGNGAYVVTNHVINEKIEFKRNKLYWNDAETVIDKATYLAIPISTHDVQRYRAGEIDVTNYGLNPELYVELKATIPDEVIVTRTLTTYMYEFNNAKAPFNDIRVRQALSLMLDRKIITDKVLNQGQTPTYVFTPPYINEGNAIEQPEWSKLSMADRNRKAVQLLKDAGFSKKKPLNFTILYNTNENHKRIAIAASSIWNKNSGGLVKVKLENQEWKTYLDNRRQGNYDVARAGWAADYNHASSFINYFLSNSSNNTAKYSNAVYDQAVADSYNTADAQGRANAYARAEAVLAKDYAIAPVYNYVNVRLVKPYVRGYAGTDPEDDIFLKNLYLVKP